MKYALLLLLLSAGLPAQENRLTPTEKRDGWILLFDGRTFNGWRDPARYNVPGDGWSIQDGVLRSKPKPWVRDDLLSEQSFDNFDLKFDFKLMPGANSGLKYRIQHVLFLDPKKLTPGPNGFEGQIGREIADPKSDRAQLARDSHAEDYTIAFEFQLLDDEKHPDARFGSDRQTGALYRMLPPSEKASKPVGEWNSARLVVRGSQVEHWLNGVKVVDGRLDDPRVLQGIRERWAPAPAVRMMLLRPMQNGPFALQHHGDEVWFRNIKVKRLNPGE